ncbi:hypothetical protein EMIHUDRAFT_466723 [Emiliania huxleyi CCMP1516]|uniref:Plastocyanin-like domain-containing protein n=2 Tax=Emiliania huxleyi TaxID=2903 RepID=A0A0D3KTA5_EMIH1|nr:hypothetical protein EMIHUDRAFT_466723 [Emiliania huxleyi CCMP1516]EOD38990.1 hypothetical protein EMIHUDRAFT_466723 [Emiliania huxleyi CCMP1516]|eukprot:XP_005791419.1 hypothetical protein EMIHUDRAFT_466723 [Emiliania huxleyi CCMP1516]
MFGVFVMLGLGAIALPTEATTARSTMFGSILEPAPPTGSIQSFCRYCGSREREDNCTDVTCQLTMGRVEMHVPLKETPHHTLKDNSGVINVTTRGYNKNTPMGPTIKVRPGDTLKVTLINNLAEEDDPDAQMAGLTNFQHDYQATNLHTHGLHISGEDPADNVFRRVAPGDNHTYTYAIPKDHMPGTHWYHPHFHGPTGIQAGGGAVGMLIVEDVVGQHGTLPKYVESLKEEKHLIILGVDANNQKGIERGGQTSVGGEGSGMLQCCLAYGNKSMSKEEFEKRWLPEDKGGACSAPASNFTAENEELLEERGMRNREAHLNDLDDRCKEKNNGASCSNEEVAELVKKNCEAAAIWHVDGKLPDHTDKSNAVIAADEALFLVNGEYVPTLKFKANVWTRLRILFASITDQMYIVFPEFCEAQLLAKDGVYLHDAPRPVKYAFLGLGNRADLLIKCTEPDPNKYPNPTLLDGLLYNQNDEDVKHNKVTNVVCNAADAIPHANKSDASVVRETLLAKAQGRITIPLMYMEIVQGVPAPTCTLPKFTVTRPCYLANLQNATKLINEEDLTQDGNLELHFGPGPDSADGKFFSDGSAFSPFTINKKRLEASLSSTSKASSITRSTGWRLARHAPGSTVPPNWCHSKAFPDEKYNEHSLNNDKNNANNLTFVVRANVDTFVSRQVVHCHVLDHEAATPSLQDWGMMTILNFTENSDGNFTFWGNKLLDPTCFQNQTSNKGATVKAKDDGTFTGLCCAGKHDRAGCGGGECIGQYYESLGYEAAVYVLGGATRDLLFSSVPVPDREPDYYACA